MPYNPGVQNRAGEFFAQGLMSAAQGLGRGLEMYQKNKEQYDEIQSKGKAAKDFLKVYSKELGLSPEQTDAMTLQHPDESPRQYAMRMAQTMSSNVVGQHMKQQAQEMALRKEELAAKQFQMQQAQAQAARDEALRQRYEQLNQFARGAGSGVYSSAAQDRMNTQLYGSSDPMNTPATDGAQQEPSDMMRAAQHYAMTGKVPSENLMAAWAAGDSREQIAQERFKSYQEREQLRQDAARQVAEARAAAEQAKNDAKGAAPKWYSDPSDPSNRVVVQNGQIREVRPQVSRDANFAQIDIMEKSGQISPMEARKLRMERLNANNQKGGMFGAFMSEKFGMPGNVGMGAGPSEPPAPRSAPAPAMPNPASPDQLLQMVRSGQLDPETAKKIATQKGW